MFILLVSLYAILYGFTMKVADLLNEHGLKLFKFSDLLFGLLWGLFGALLILSNQTVGNIVVAMNIAFIMRNRLDYLNHQIGASIIIIAFLLVSKFEPLIFIPFYFTFLIFGSLKDYVGDKLKLKKGILVNINEAMWYYPIPSFIFSIIVGNWLVFVTFLLYTLSYDLTKYYAMEKGFP